MGKLILNTVVVVLICASVQAKTSSDMGFGVNFPAPRADNITQTMQLWATYYFMPIFNHRQDGAYPLLNKSEQPLGPQLNLKEWCEAALEGSVIVKFSDEHLETYNYAGLSDTTQADCSPYFNYPSTGKVRFRKAVGPYGDGAEETSYILVPYRSIAIDSTIIPFGSIVYIPAARDVVVTLKDGTTFKHDGYFYAVDKGGAIKKNHIDVYEGVEPTSAFAHFVRNSSRYTFEAHLINDLEIRRVLERMHLPQ